MTIPIIVQNADRDIRVKDYDKMDGKIAVTSIFRTIQGEGPYAGSPSVFIRLAGCNFGSKTSFCNFCDTSFHFDDAIWYTAEELFDEVAKVWRQDDVIVITGGEPLLQHSLIGFFEVVERHLYMPTIQIETNGTQAAFFDKFISWEETVDHVAIITFVCSPKASNRAGRYGKLSDRVLDNVYCLKFVLDADPNSPHHTVPEWALKSHMRVYVSPMAIYAKSYKGEVSSIWEDGLINRERTRENYAYAAQYALDNNLMLSLQTHLFIDQP